MAVGNQSAVVSGQAARSPRRVAFIEAKTIDHERIQELLARCSAFNHWANRGPLYEELSRSYHGFMNVGPDRAVVPCANGGIALEAMARLNVLKAGRPLRWVVSAFSFRNLARGYFADCLIVDCDQTGMLCLDELTALSHGDYDGIIVTNPFGLARDFSAYEEFAAAHGKLLMLDNAAGTDRQIPECRYQSFSLHHTKPFGVGEGGLAVVPAGEAEDFYALIDYGDLPEPATALWLNNGKLSDIACAYQLARLEAFEDWRSGYVKEAERVNEIAYKAGLLPLMRVEAETIATSVPFVADRPLPLEHFGNEHLVLGKYYKPLARMPNALDIYERLVNVPSHPGVGRLSAGVLGEVLQRIKGLVS